MASIRVENDRLVFRATAGENFLKLSSEARNRLGSENVSFFRGGYAVPFSCGAQLLEIFPKESNVWSENALLLAEGEVSKARRHTTARKMVEEALKEPYKFLKPSAIIEILDNHQVEAVAAMTVPGLTGFCLFDEQGTGKTLMTIAAFDMLFTSDDINTMIVFAPKTMLKEWMTEFERFLPGRYSMSLVTGQKDERRKALDQDAKVFLLNFQGAASELTKLITLTRHPERKVLLVVDESFFVKNKEALRSASIRELRRHCEKAFVLCGTPAPNASRDIINQFDIADDGVTFRNFKVPDEEEVARSAIKTRIEQSGIYLRRLKSDVFSDIPEKVVEKVFVDLQPIQRIKYNDVLHDLILKVRKTNDIEFRQKISSFLAQRSVLLQICLNPKKFDHNYTETPCKYLAMDRILKAWIEEKKKKAVLWSAYRFSLRELAKRYQKYNPVRIDGSITSLEERSEAIKRFQEYPQIMLFIGNPAVAGAGITLTASKYNIYESFSNQAAHYQQSIDRTHRRGQIAKQVEYHVVLCRDTIEIPEFERLLSKDEAARDLLGDNVLPPITRESFLSELEATAV